MSIVTANLLYQKTIYKKNGFRLIAKDSPSVIYILFLLYFKTFTIFTENNIAINYELLIFTIYILKCINQFSREGARSYITP